MNTANLLRVRCPDCSRVFVPQFEPEIQPATRPPVSDRASMRVWQSLSRRERLVLALIARGRTSEDIAEIVGWRSYGRSIANGYASKIFNKIGCQDRVQAVVFVADHPLLRRMLAEELARFNARSREVTA